MADTDYKNLPLLGVGMLLDVKEEHLGFCLLLLEIIIFTLLEGVSWYLFALSLVIFYGSGFRAQCYEIMAKITVFLLPRVEDNSVEDEDDLSTQKELKDDEEKYFQPLSSSPRCSQPDLESVWCNDIIGKPASPYHGE